jgi:uncharacterized protein YjbI with pentapeptide repeats
VLIALVALGYFWTALYQEPVHQATVVRQAADQLSTGELSAKDRLSLERDLYAFQADARIKLLTLSIQTIGGAVLLLGLIFTWRNLRATLAKLEVDRESQITNRFTQAVSQLGAETKDGKPAIEIRVGSIYALERVARDSPRDKWSIMEILAAYVRQNSPWSEPSRHPETEEAEFRRSMRERFRKPTNNGDQSPRRLRIDVQAALSVIGRRDTSGETNDSPCLDLSCTNLRGADLSRANLDRATLFSSNLEAADLTECRLREADLRRCFMSDAQLTRADLSGANLSMAQLFCARLSWAKMVKVVAVSPGMWGAEMIETNLEGARLLDANLRELSTLKANFTGADLEGSDLTGTRTDAAIWNGAKLDRVTGFGALAPDSEAASPGQ